MKRAGPSSVGSLQDVAHGQNGLADAYAALARATVHDGLTGLPNRRYFDEYALEAQALFRRGRAHLSVFRIDLDRFNHVNDLFGPDSGDLALREIAARLRTISDEEDVIVRVDGDEFLVIRHDRVSNEEAVTLAETLRAEIAHPISLNGRDRTIEASIGIAVRESSDSGLADVAARAAYALTRAKQSGRNTVALCSETDRAQAVERRAIALDMRGALDRGEFEPFYQLQFDARSRCVVGMEALARWRHPERGVLTPDRFLGVADEIGLASALDEQIMQRAARDMIALDDAGLRVEKVSLNLSARRLEEGRLLTDVAGLPLAQERISFEILETAFLDDPSPEAASTLAGLRAMGSTIEVDDFGTGHASLLCLASLRPYKLKVDRSLVMPIVESVESRQVLKAIVDVGAAMEIRVTAEGVETEEHATILADLGCHCLQGFGLARPAAIASVAERLAKEGR